MYAFGKKPEEILDFFKSVYFFSWRHFTLKPGGMLDSEAFKIYFEGVFGKATINDLKIETQITATDLVTGNLKVFDNNTLIVDAILASTAVPGIVSPHVIKGQIYSDGGILNHFPTDLLIGKCDFLIGVYVSSLEIVDPDHLNSLKAVTARAYNLLSSHSDLLKFELCDWLIQPYELSSYSTFDTSKLKMDAIFNIGYQAAKISYTTRNTLENLTQKTS
jgi:NTE family protein